MSSVSLPIAAMAVLALALSSCTATPAKLSTHNDRSTGQANSARPFSEPVPATEPKSAPTLATPTEPRDLTQNPVSDSSLANSSTVNSPAIDHSSAAQPDPRMALAQHLTSIGAKIYMAGWCPVCKRQKRDFGEAAFAMLTAIDCEQKPALCADAGVHRYPTWEINGQQYVRGFPISELAHLSNYSGPTLPTP